MALEIPEEHAEALSALVRLDSDQFDALRDLLTQEPPSAEPSKVAERIADRFRQAELPRPAELIDSVFQMLRTKSRFSGTDSQFLEHVLDGMDEAIEKPLSAQDREIAAERIQSLIAPNGPISRSFKAYDVLTTHQNVYRSCRMLTDIRPVFFDDVDQPFSEVVTVHTLKIDYASEGNLRKTFYVALDAADLRDLRKAIERAEKKNSAVELRLQELGVHVSNPEHE